MGRERVRASEETDYACGGWRRERGIRGQRETRDSERRRHRERN